jgi:hypothetical protein
MFSTNKNCQRWNILAFKIEERHVRELRSHANHWWVVEIWMFTLDQAINIKFGTYTHEVISLNASIIYLLLSFNNKQYETEIRG